MSKSKKPFIVKTNDGFVKVYGTQFNVNNNLEAMLSVALIEGSVGVTTKQEGEYLEVKIKPNQLFDYNGKRGESQIKNIDCSAYIEWMNNDFFYRSQDLLKVLSDLERWYGVEFSYNKDELSDIQISINTAKPEKLLEMINIIENTVNIRIINNGKDKFHVEKKAKK